MPTQWIPPDPGQLPEWRSQMLDHLASTPAMMTMREALRAGRSTIVPTVPGLDVSEASDGAVILTRSERDRLERAELYYATPDMTALALAAAQTPPTEPVSLRRLPAPAGLIVFGEPIGGYTEDAAQALAGTLAHRPGASALITTPIVAVSWSEWSPDAVRLDQGARVRWTFKSRAGSGTIPDGWRGAWLTFWSPRGMFSGLDPAHVIGTTRDGFVMTAGDIDAHRETGGPPLGWDNEMLIAEGKPFGPAEPDTTASWAHVLYTAFQLMSQDQGRNRWTDTQEVPRARAGAKRDARQGIQGSGAVRIVNVHSAHRPPAGAAQDDVQASTGRREPQWSCRWPVRPYRRFTCLNPSAHADGGCQHEDRIVPGHIKGPQDAPLRTGERVTLWDHQPTEATS
ncbi:hypothetical protein JHN49_04545 [Streptomyces sp. MBT57]|nr:hypothetical protein [Streptomyces sp. MBT57]